MDHCRRGHLVRAAPPIWWPSKLIYRRPPARGQPVELHGDGDFGPGLFQRGRPEAQGNTEPQEAVLQLEAGETQKISRLAQADLVGKVGLKGGGVRIALRPFMLHLNNGALSERLEEPEVQGIKKHGLVSTGLLDESHLALLHAIDHLLGVRRKISLGDRGSRHEWLSNASASLHQREPRAFVCVVQCLWHRSSEMATVRLDVKTEEALKRLTLQRGQTKSEVIRDAIARLGEEKGEQVSAYHRLQPFIGVADSGGRQLSERTGEKLRELLEEKRRARRSG